MGQPNINSFAAFLMARRTKFTRSFSASLIPLKNKGKELIPLVHFDFGVYDKRLILRHKKDAFSQTRSNPWIF